MKLGQKIKNFRNRARLSQLELELMIDASPGSISRIETGEVNPTKETILKIIEVLNISSFDAASLFDVSIESEVVKIAEISRGLNKIDSLNDILIMITKKFVSYIGVNLATVWFWDKNLETLTLESITLPERVLIMVEKFLGKSIGKLTLDAKNPDCKKNDYIRSIIQDELIVSHSVYDLSYTILNKATSDIIEKVLNFKSAISVPLKFDNKCLGILGLIWPSDIFTEGDKLMIQAFADQISIAIYNAQRFEDLNQKYLELIRKNNEK